MSDDTQAQFSDPSNADCEPPIFVRIATAASVQQFTMTPPHPCYPLGCCVVGDGMSEIVSTPPNYTPDNRDYERIVRICELCKTSVKRTDRIALLLGLLHVPASDDRIGLIAVRLGARPELIDNAERLLREPV